MTKRTRSHLGLPQNPDNPQTDQDNPNQDHASGPLFTHVNPEENQTINPNDARVTIEMNQYKYTDVPITTLHLSQLTKEDLAEAIRQYPGLSILGPAQGPWSPKGTTSQSYQGTSPGRGTGPGYDLTMPLDRGPYMYQPTLAAQGTD